MAYTSITRDALGYTALRNGARVHFPADIHNHDFASCFDIKASRIWSTASSGYSGYVNPYVVKIGSSILVAALGAGAVSYNSTRYLARHDSLGDTSSGWSKGTLYNSSGAVFDYTLLSGLMATNQVEVFGGITVQKTVGGHSGTFPSTILGTGSVGGNDRPVFHSTGHARLGFSTNYRMLVSTNGGISYTTGAASSLTATNRSGHGLVYVTGTTYKIFQSISTSHQMRVSTSTDAGATWSADADVTGVIGMMSDIVKMTDGSFIMAAIVGGNQTSPYWDSGIRPDGSLSMETPDRYSAIRIFKSTDNCVSFTHVCSIPIEGYAGLPSTDGRQWKRASLIEISANRIGMAYHVRRNDEAGTSTPDDIRYLSMNTGSL